MALPNSPLLDANGRITLPWLQWLSREDMTTAAARLVGPTSGRPEPKHAFRGMRYFDTDLGADAIGMPVYAAVVEPAGVTWVDATGAIV
mgnify:CR=1 FL=1